MYLLKKKRKNNTALRKRNTTQPRKLREYKTKMQEESPRAIASHEITNHLAPLSNL